MTPVENALIHWGFEVAQLTLIAARENEVFRVDHLGQRFALRLHRHNYRSDDELLAELDWMAWLAKNGLSVPDPVPSLMGPKLVRVMDTQIDVLSWVNGTTLDQVLPGLDLASRAQIFYKIGAHIAKLNMISDTWPGAATCSRPHWDCDGLVGENPLWGKFWQNLGLSADQQAKLVAFRDRARQDLTQRLPTLDYGLIHADLVSQNVMIDVDKIHLIDFDDGGFGFRIFDVATALYPHRSAADFVTLKSKLIAGYQSVRPLDVSALALFMALRAMTYVGWNITRMHEDTTGNRNARFIDAALTHADAYLA